MRKQENTTRILSVSSVFSYGYIILSGGLILRYLYRYGYGSENLKPTTNITLFMCAAITYFLLYFLNLGGSYLIYLYALCGGAYFAHYSYMLHKRKNKITVPARHSGKSIFSFVPVFGSTDSFLSLFVEPFIIALVAYMFGSRYGIIQPTALYILAGVSTFGGLVEAFKASSMSTSIDETVELAKASMQRNVVDEHKQFIIKDTPEAIKQERARIFKELEL